MLVTIVRDLLLREVRAVRREIEAYPSEASLWSTAPGVSNPGGTLALHLAGNLQHFVGAKLGATGYVRDRDAEFARRDVPRAQILAELDAALAAVKATLDRLADEDLVTPYPDPVAGGTVPAREFLIHLATHLAYHLGQIDYHRRLVSGDPGTVDAVATREMPSVLRAAR